MENENTTTTSEENLPSSAKTEGMAETNEKDDRLENKIDKVTDLLISHLEKNSN